jgi:hypothetical protein
MLSVICKPHLLSVIMMKVVMLSVVMLSVVTPQYQRQRIMLYEVDNCSQCYKTFFFATDDEAK